MIGCASSPSDSTDKSKGKTADKNQAKPMEVIKTHNGEATDRGEKDERLWTIYWVDGDIDVPTTGPKQLDKGAMTDVHGQIYKDPAIASTFKAKHGTADRVAQILTLTDQVVLTSTDPEFTVMCDKAVYNAKLKIIKAIGHVQVTGTLSTVGTIDELWTTPDFKKIASPRLFTQP